VTATLTLRPAGASDAELICLIYNQGIEDRVATLETELRTPAERRECMAVRGPRHPVIVAESAGSVAGWGSLNVFNARPAYQHVADFFVYVGRKWRSATCPPRCPASPLSSWPGIA
jgi:L-amino acid N-acyltransferase YncA